MCVQKNYIVDNQSNQHDCHFQLVIYPEENRTRNEAQDAAVDKILEKKNQNK